MEPSTEIVNDPNNILPLIVENVPDKPTKTPKKSIARRSDLSHLDPRIIVVKEGFNPRKSNWGDMEGLTKSIIENGVLMPIRVKRIEEGKFQLIDGERRLRATNQAIAQGYDIKTIPAIIERKHISDANALYTALITNEGQQLDPIEQADAMKRLRSYGETVDDIAKKMGTSVSTVHNRLILVDASPQLKTAIIQKKVSTSAAVAIVRESKGNIDKQKDMIKKTKGNKVYKMPRRIRTKLHDVLPVRLKKAKSALNDTGRYALQTGTSDKPWLENDKPSPVGMAYLAGKYAAAIDVHRKEELEVPVKYLGGLSHVAYLQGIQDGFKELYKNEEVVTIEG